MKNQSSPEAVSEAEEEAESFLEAFFDVEDALNRVDYDKALAGTGKKYRHIRQWIEPLRSADPQPTVLPRVVEKGGEVQTWWYGIAQSDAQLRHLVEEVRAFVGPSYSDFRGQRATLHGDRDPIEKAVQAFTGGAALRFRGDGKKVREALNLMHATRERREERAPSVPRSKGLVLRDFHMALEAGDRGAAREAIQYVKERSLLDALNRRYLRIQLLHYFHEWEEMLALDLEDVFEVRRPLAVTEALVQAVYHVELASFEAEGDAEGAREHFQQVVRRQYATLYDVRSKMRSPEALKSFMLEAGDESSTTDPDQLLEEACDAGVADDFLRQLAPEKEHTAPDKEEALPKRARAACEAGEYDRAFELATEISPPTPQKVRLLLECATELQNTEADSRAVEAVHELDEADRKAVFHSGLMTAAYKSLVGGTEPAEAETAPPVPTSWIAWLERLANDADWKRQRAVEMAKRGQAEWSIADLAEDPEASDRMEELLIVLIDERQRALMRSLPHLIGALRGDPAFPRPELAGVYEHFLSVIRYSDRASGSHLTLFNEMARAVLRLGSEEKRYADMVTTTEDLWKQEGALVHIDWVLDFLDLLVIYPTKAEEALLRLLTQVAQALRRYEERLECERLVFFQRLCRELGHPDAAPDFSLPELEEEHADPLTKFAGQRVAIYTLDENAGRRAQRLIDEVCPEADVRLNHEKQGSEQLRSLARNADYFVVVTGAAKHAATEYIEAEREGRDVLYPTGTGSSSILRKLREEMA